MGARMRAGSRMFSRVALAMALIFCKFSPALAVAPAKVECKPSGGASGENGEVGNKQCAEGGGGGGDGGGNMPVKLTGVNIPAKIPFAQASFNLTPLGNKANALCPLQVEIGPVNSSATVWLQKKFPMARVGQTIVLDNAPQQNISSYEVRVVAIGNNCTGNASAVLQLQKDSVILPIQKDIIGSLALPPLPGSVVAGQLVVAGNLVSLPELVSAGEIRVAGNVAFLPGELSVGQLQVIGGVVTLPSQVSAGSLAVTGQL